MHIETINIIILNTTEEGGARIFAGSRFLQAKRKTHNRMQLQGLIYTLLVFFNALVLNLTAPVYLKGEKVNLAEDVIPVKLSAADVITAINEEKDQNFFEGDIVLSQYTRQVIEDNGGSSRVIRSVQRSRKTLWQTKVVPHEFDITVNDLQKERVQDAIDAIKGISCIQWKVKTNESNWVRFVNKSGCWSAIGKEFWREGAQEISLGDGCKDKGVIIHEILHSLGFWHEQSRPDRNQYVEIMWENIEPGKEDNFEKYSHGEIDSLGSTYDYDSIMHYGKYGFSANGQPTLLALGDPSRDLGQRESLSTGDILKLNTLYDCSGPTGGWSSWSLFTPCDEACNQYRQRFCTLEDKRSACPEADQYGIETENKVCANETCHAPIDGHWGRWSAWGSCSASCGEGNRIRTRECNDPLNLNGGRYCQGYANQTERCLIQSCGVGSDDCNFDEDEWCHWKHDVTGTSPLPWYRGTRGTPTSRTGPSTDHTTGTGGFLYSESSNPVQTGQSTRLISKEIRPTLNARCMHFFYSMYGEGMGTLNVYLKNPITRELVRIWDTSGNQGNHWQHGDVTISTTHTYQIIFESICGSDYRSDIGLDDITFTNGSCNDKNTSTSAPTTLPTAVTTPSPADICDFGVTSGTTCTWYNDPQNPRTTDNFFRYMWWVHRGTTPSRGTGPYSDHSNHGYYIYLEASSPYCKGMKARLISKLYQPSMTMCMNFWYFMYGRSVGTLAVFIDNISGRIQVWSKRGNQADQWLHAVIPLSSSTAFKIIIEGTRGSGYLGDIALDDIIVSHTSC